MKKKGIGTAAAAPAPFVINTGGSGGNPLKIILGGLVLIGATFFGKKAFDNYQKNKGEAETDSPAGAIALQLKNVFASFPVSDADYKRVKLQVDSSNNDDVYRIYRQITGRSLTDDESKHITAGTQTNVAKQQAINNVPGTIIKITSDDKIQFLVGKGNQVIANPAAPGGKIPIYAKPTDIATGNPIRMMKVTSLKLDVEQTMEVPFEKYVIRQGWAKILLPLVKTRKVFAAIGFSIPLGPGKKSSTLWLDARTVVLPNLKQVKGINALEGWL